MGKLSSNPPPPSGRGDIGGEELSPILPLPLGGRWREETLPQILPLPLGGGGYRWGRVYLPK